MLNDNLKDLEWKCYANEKTNNIFNIIGTIDVSNNKDLYNENGEKNKQEATGIIVDSKLVDILEELYYLVALEKIDFYENNVYKELALLKLDEMAQRYNTLLRLKQMYYTEVHMSIERINSYSQLGDYLTEKEICMLHKLERFYVGLSKGYYRIGWEHAEFLESPLYLDVLRRLKEICHIWDYGKSRLFKKIFNALLNIVICYEKNGLNKHNDEKIKLWLEIFLVLRNEHSGRAGEIAWLLFLVNIFKQICSDLPQIEPITIHPEENWEKELNHAIERTNKLLEDVFGKNIYDMQKSLMFCYIAKPLSEDVFDTKVRDLVEALKKMSEKKEYKKIKTKYLDKKPEGCIAIMHSASKHYVALSGSEFFNKCSYVLRKILGPAYKVVDLNSDVRYYYTKRSYITYGNYSDCKNDKYFLDKNKVENVNKMFSCCERKLLTKLYGKKCNGYTIYVKKKVCGMCQKAIKHFDEVQNCKGKIMYPENSTSDRCRKSSDEELNEIAIKIKEIS